MAGRGETPMSSDHRRPGEPGDEETSVRKPRSRTNRLKLTAREKRVFGASSSILGVFSAIAGLVSFYVHGGTTVLLWSAGLLVVASVIFVIVNRNIGRRVGLPLLGAVSVLISAVIVAAAIG